MEYLMSIDAGICLVTGAIIGGLAGQIPMMKNLGLLPAIGIGAASGLIAGFLLDWLDIMNIGDIADPVIAGLVGSVIVLAIAGAIRSRGGSGQIRAGSA